jgi:hypothetical protein
MSVDAGRLLWALQQKGEAIDVLAVECGRQQDKILWLQAHITALESTIEEQYAAGFSPSVCRAMARFWEGLARRREQERVVSSALATK